MKKVKMLLSNGFDPDLRVYKEAQYIVNKGYDLEIVCWDREFKHKDKPEEVINGIKIKRIFHYAKYGTGLKQISGYFKFWKDAKKYLKGQDIDVLHCHELDTMLIGLGVKAKTKVFDMHEYYASTSSSFVNALIRLIVGRLQNKADYIIWLNERQKRDIKEKNYPKLVEITNYPESKKFEKCKKTESDILRINFIGTVRYFENSRNLIEAADNNENVELNFYGSGVAVEKLEYLKEKYHNFFLHGKYNHDNVGELYDKTDVLFCAYDTDNENDRNAFPTKLFESIISVTPIIVNKFSAMGEFVKEKNIGFAIDPNNKQELSDLIVNLVENKEILTEKTANLKKIQNTYKWENIVKNLDKIYR